MQGIRKKRRNKSSKRAVIVVVALLGYAAMLGSSAIRERSASLLDVALSPLVSILPSYQRAQSIAANALDAANFAERNAALRGEEIFALELRLRQMQEDAERSVEAHAQESGALLKRLRLLSSQLVEETHAEDDVEIQTNADATTVIRVGNQVLYDKGSAALKPAGKRLLSRIARTLNGQEIQSGSIRVEGHTDNLPILSRAVHEKYPTNWHLSAARAASAVEFLQREANVPAVRLRAVGLGEFRPVASNETEQGRAENRRIEIVIEPATSMNESRQETSLESNEPNRLRS